jgi:trimeric autotransporter adhesin
MPLASRVLSANALLAVLILPFCHASFSALIPDAAPGENGVRGGDVFALAANGYNMFVGGSFRTASNLLVNYLTEWSAADQNFKQMKTGTAIGLDGPVMALALSNQGLFIGGSFDFAGGVPAVGLALWNGTNFRSFASGSLNGVAGGLATVKALALNGTDLWIGGSFTTILGTTCNHVCRLDITSGIFYPLQPASVAGVSGTSTAEVRALAVIGSALWIGGYFANASNIPMSSIVKYNGAFIPITSGAAVGVSGTSTPSISAIVAVPNGFEDDIYLGGAFTSLAGTTCSSVCRWNGTHALPLQMGANQGTSGSVAALAIGPGNVLWVGGTFTTFAGVTGANYVVKYDGQTVTAVGSGIDSTVSAIAFNGTVAVLGGLFSTAGSTTTTAFRLTRWTGSSFSAFLAGKAVGITGTGFALAYLSSQGMVVGGTFDEAGGITVNNAAIWAGPATGFKQMKSSTSIGFGASIRAMVATSSSALVLVGSFVTVRGVGADRIVSWNPTSGAGFSHPSARAMVLMARRTALPSTGPTFL